MDQIIIAMSGRKQAGKNTLGQFIKQYYAEQQASFQLSNLTQGRDAGYISLEQHQEKADELLTFECSFADALKDFCIDVLGLPYEACYGTEEEKNAPTQYEWDDVPRFIAWKFADDLARKLVAQGKTQDELMDEFYNMRLSQVAVAKGMELPNKLQRSYPCYMDGPMTGRDIMQVFGTDLVRQTFGNVWAKATIRRIKKIGKPFSVITDNRFPDEVETVLTESKGFVIRLTRSPFGLNDVHSSESALDDFDWNRERCFILNNAEMTIEEQNEAIKPVLSEILGF
jgi:hypothetical protein